MMDTKIYLVTYTDDCNNTLVDYGVGNITLKTYILPAEPLKNFSPLGKDTNGVYIKCEPSQDDNGSYDY